MDWNTAADRHHERMVQVELDEARRHARETAMALVKIAGMGFVLISCCFTIACIGAAIILPFMK